MVLHRYFTALDYPSTGASRGWLSKCHGMEGFLLTKTVCGNTAQVLLLLLVFLPICCITGLPLRHVPQHPDDAPPQRRQPGPGQ
jgi:hypothetical protein